MQDWTNSLSTRRFGGQNFKAQPVSRGWFGGLGMTSLHFADDLSDGDLQLALGQFAAKCEVLVMTVRSSKSETVVACPLQVQRFKYLGFLFLGDGS